MLGDVLQITHLFWCENGLSSSTVEVASTGRALIPSNREQEGGIGFTDLLPLVVEFKVKENSTEREEV